MAGKGWDCRMRGVLALVIIGGALFLGWAILSGRYPAALAQGSATSSSAPAGQAPNPSTGGTQ